MSWIRAERDANMPEGIAKAKTAGMTIFPFDIRGPFVWRAWSSPLTASMKPLVWRDPIPATNAETGLVDRSADLPRGLDLGAHEFEHHRAGIVETTLICLRSRNIAQPFAIGQAGR
jgi:hypothetical protein